MRQRSTVSAGPGIDPEAQSAAESSARRAVLLGEPSVEAPSGIAALGLVYLFGSVQREPAVDVVGTPSHLQLKRSFHA